MLANALGCHTVYSFVNTTPKETCFEYWQHISSYYIMASYQCDMDLIVVMTCYSSMYLGTYMSTTWVLKRGFINSFVLFMCVMGILEVHISTTWVLEGALRRIFRMVVSMELCAFHEYSTVQNNRFIIKCTFMSAIYLLISPTHWYHTNKAKGLSIRKHSDLEHTRTLLLWTRYFVWYHWDVCYLQHVLSCKSNNI